MAISEEQKTHKQHAVPQNIMDVEFKLIGDLTMRQFIYLFVFGVLAYVMYISMVGVFRYPLTAFFVLFGLALAFVPIQERGMDEWFVNFFRSVFSPTQRVWKKEPVLPPAFTYQNLALVKQELITLAPTSSRRKLEEYLEIQQKTQEEDKLDIPEMEYVLKVRQAFAPVATEVGVEEEEYQAEEYETYEPYQPAFAQEQAPEQVSEQMQEQMVEQPPAQQPPKEEAAAKPSEAPAPEAKPVKEKVEKPKPAPAVKKKPKKPKLPPIKTTIPDTFMSTPMTPDRHIGRKFTSMLPSEGQLILPVRGEKVIATSEEIDIQKDIDDKTEQLRKLLDQIKGDKELGQAAVEKAADEGEKTAELSEAQDVVKRVKEENERLSNEIQKLKNEIDDSQDTEEEKSRKRKLVEELEKEKDKAKTDYTSLQRQVLDLQNRLKEKEQPQEDTGPKRPTFAKMQPITNEPNIVSGVIKDSSGEAIPGVVLLVKNHKGEAVRALKTNAIGQFSISTPLVNGMYTMEVGSSVEGMAFDIITVEVKGEVIPPIELIGREV